MRAGDKGRAVIAAAVMVSSCSLFTGLDGFSNAGSGPEADATSQGADASSSDAPTAPGPPKPRAWRQATVTAPPARHSARMAYDETRKRAVLFGGASPTTSAFDETWEWDGAGWLRPTLTASPTGRRSPGLVYDRVRRVVVVYGGAANALAEPWEWDGGPAWRSSGTSPASPNVRNGAAMAYDASRDVIVVFGGHISETNTQSGDTWEWSATAGFSKRTPSLSPPARTGHFMVYDETRRRVLLFAGYSGGVDRNDLWEWDGATWTQRTPPISPSPRTAPCGAYDATRKVVVVFGGRNNTSKGESVADTWEWDGESWRQGPTGPSARRSCGMAFDSARDAIVMYGGASRRANSVSEPLGDTWIYQ